MMRRVGGACLAWAIVASAALADVVADCNQAREPTPRLGACSEPVGANIDSIIGLASINVAPSKRTETKPFSDAADVGDARKGLTYAQQLCSGCHNVLRIEMASPNKQAPPFKVIANTPGMSVTALTVWSRTSHPTMPNLIIEPKDMENLIAYILSLRDR